MVFRCLLAGTSDGIAHCKENRWTATARVGSHSRGYPDESSKRRKKNTYRQFLLEGIVILPAMSSQRLIHHGYYDLNVGHVCDRHTSY